MRPSLAISKFFLTLLMAFVCRVNAQDTLHLDFGNTQTVPDKAMEDKIVAWGKTLNGQKQDIKVYAYYHKGEFKQFAQQRLDEMYLSINRKVRDLVNIKEQEAKKGENYQRTRVDIIYSPMGAVVSKDKKGSNNSNSNAAKNDKKDSKADNKNANAKSDNKNSNSNSNNSDSGEDAPTTAVANPNGTGKDAGKKKGDEGKVIKYDPNKEYLDSTYVNGVLKITKRKKK